MTFTIYIAGLLLIYGVCIFALVRATRKNAESDLQAFAATVPAPLTPAVRQWLAPQLLRRSYYPTSGGLMGLAAPLSPFASGWEEVPWYWFAGLLGMGAGFTVGTLVAGYRTAPLLDGPVRTVDPAQRRLSDYLDRLHVVRLRLAVMVSTFGAVLTVAIWASTDSASAQRALLACGLGLVLVGAHYWVAAVVIARPLVASNSDGLLWQKALLDKTVNPMSGSAFLVAVFSAAIALYSVAVNYRDIPSATLLLGGSYALFAGVSAIYVLVVDNRRLHESMARSGNTMP
ncbi:hypothetical protein GCM10027020_19180 [Nocardioides salsibiostraticola]